MLAHILDNIEVGVMGFDINNNCIYVNNFIKKQFGIYVEADKVKMDVLIETHVHPDDISNVVSQCYEFLDKNESDTNNESLCRIMNKITSDYHWYKLHRIRQNDEEYNGYYHLCTFEDVNALKSLEIELRETNKKKEEAYAHKSLFLANMSHEIRTPLNGIIGMMTLLEDTDLSDDQRNYVGMLRECSINLMTIINDILDYSKLEAGKISLDSKCINLRGCIESTSDIILSKLYEKGIEYNYFIDTDVPNFINGDVNRIKQILLNLLSNSIKFTEKGDIVLRVSVVSGTNEKIYIKFTVKDTGCGIDPNDKDKLFHSFSQVESSRTTKIHQGTGLGLAISKQLVSLMNGDIWLEWSEYGKGSVFCFNIQADKCDASNELVDISEKTKDKMGISGKRVFILDDRRENRLSLASTVKKWGMIPVIFSDPKEALFFIKSNEYDLGLVDMCMPEMDGREFAFNLQQYFIKTQQSQIPLIALSSLGEINTDRTQNLFQAYLIKPVKEAKLKNICNDILISSGYKYVKTIQTNKADTSLNSYINANYLADNIKDSIRILLVEDVPINQKVVTSFLIKLGFKTVDVTENGIEALRMMAKKEYDLILLDIRMPILNGETLMKYILDYYKGEDNSKKTYILVNHTRPYVIAVTAYSLKEDREKYLKMGFNDYIPKPISINELNKCMNSFVSNLLTK